MANTVDLEKLKKRYLEVGRVDPLVEEFGYSGRTLRRYLKKAGVDLKRGVRKGSILFTRHFGCLPNWIMEHPEEPLPEGAGPKEISEITGCSLDSVKSYLWRIKNVLKKKVKKLDVGKLTGTITSATGFPFPVAAVANWKSFTEDLAVGIDIITKNGSNHRLWITPGEVDRLLKRQGEKDD